MYQQVKKYLKQAYDDKVEERDRTGVSPWKHRERQHFLDLLQVEGKTSLLDLGSGPGVHGKFFRDAGLTVTCIDLSPGMVNQCRAKGLTAYEMDFSNLDFQPGTFDAVFAMNSLLHLPREKLKTVLENIQGLLKINGLYYWGQYGGKDHEGIWESDHYEPKRFFSFMTDDCIQTVAGKYYSVISFKQIAVEGKNDIHFQSLVLRRR